VDVALEWDFVKTCQAVVPHQVVFRTLASETVLLNIETGYYFGLDEIGGRFFEVLREAASVGAAVELLAREFDAPAEQIQSDMLGYCGQLLGHGLIELREPEAQTRARHG
jgi:phosphatidylserine/phosphatidylglycerophosphate/cardiolipin synthase-like enzyme